MQRTRTTITVEDEAPSSRGNATFVGIIRRGPGICRVTISQERYEQARRDSLVPVESLEAVNG